MKTTQDPEMVALRRKESFPRYSDIVAYAKKSDRPNMLYRKLYGVRSSRPGYYFPNICTNLFEEKAKKVPKGYKRTRKTKWRILKFISNPAKRLVTERTVYERGKKYYHIHDNGDRPYTVVVANKTVTVYKFPSNTYIWTCDSEISQEFNTEKVVQWRNVVKVWPGKNNSEKDTKDSWAFGNTVLVQLSPWKYAYIGNRIYTFCSREQVIDYTSPVGPSNVPYPVAKTQHGLIFMLDMTYVPLDEFDFTVSYRPADEGEFLYDYYYQQEKSISPRKLEKLRVIRKSWAERTREEQKNW